jgi:hydrogenase expression/formation protein HypC
MCLAIGGKVLETEEQDGLRLGRVQFGGIIRAVRLDFVPEAQRRRLRGRSRSFRHYPC